MTLNWTEKVCYASDAAVIVAILFAINVVALEMHTTSKRVRERQKGKRAEDLVQFLFFHSLLIVLSFSLLTVHFFSPVFLLLLRTIVVRLFLLSVSLCAICLILAKCV